MKTLNTNFSRNAVISSWVAFYFSYSAPLEITTRQITLLPTLNALSTHSSLCHCSTSVVFLPNVTFSTKLFMTSQQQQQKWPFAPLGALLSSVLTSGEHIFCHRNLWDCFNTCSTYKVLRVRTKCYSSSLPVSRVHRGGLHAYIFKEVVWRISFLP